MRGPDDANASHKWKAEGDFAIDRQLGRLISVCGPLLMIGMTVPTLADAANFAAWWNIIGAILAATILVGAVAGHRLPARVLRAWWVAGPAVGAVLFGTAFLAYHGPDPDPVVPWVWTFEAILVTYPVLWLPVWGAISGAVVSGLLPALSGLLVLGRVPESVAALTPIHVSNLAFIVLFAGMRARLNRLRAAERRAGDLDEQRVRAAADAEHRRRRTAMVHDHVLSVLTAAAAFTGRPPPALRAEAREALRRLDGPPLGTGEHPLDTAAARDRLLTGLASIDPDCPVRSRVAPGTVPGDVVDAVVGAAAEALRNSLRHAGPGATRVVDATFDPAAIRVEIIDDGPGFDPAAVDAARLGVRASIAARMRSVPGGDATIDTRPEQGVRVVASWRS